MSCKSDAQLPIDEAIRRKLRAEHLRTGISAKVLLARQRNVPDGLTASHVSRWIGGVIKYAPAAHVDYILQLWSSVRDDAGRIDKSGQPIARPGRRHPKTGKTWITITDDMRAALRDAMMAKGLGAKQLSEIAGAPPELSRRMINAWVYGDSASARQKFWDFVISRCRE